MSDGINRDEVYPILWATVVDLCVEGEYFPRVLELCPVDEVGMIEGGDSIDRMCCYRILGGGRVGT